MEIPKERQLRQQRLGLLLEGFLIDDGNCRGVGQRHLERVAMLSVYAEFIMQVGARRQAAHAYMTNDVALSNALAFA